MEVLAKACLSIFGNPEVPTDRAGQSRDGDGVRGASARADATSSAATEMRKNIGVKKSTFEREKRQNYLIKGFRTRKQNPKIRVTLNNNYDF